MVLFCQPETDAATAGRQQIFPGDVRELLFDSADSAEGDGAESPEEFLGRNIQAIFRLSRKHPPILVTARRIAAQVIAASK